MNDSTSFPQDLAQVPEAERIQETFGWAPAAWALVLFTFTILLAFQPAKLSTGERISLFSALLSGLLLCFYEVWRRRQPRVLVRRGPSLALYLRGELVREMGIAAIGISPRHRAWTWGPILVTALGALVSGIFLMYGDAATAGAQRLTAGMAALSFAALCASIVRTHLFCEATLIPNDGGGGLQQVLVHKRDLPRIFRPTS